MAFTIDYVDRPARQRAADLLDEYLAGRADAEGLREHWPQSDIDRCLAGIANVALPLLDDGLYSQRRQEDLAPVLQRCLLHLRSDNPYVQGDPAAATFIVKAGFGAVCVLAWLAVMPYLKTDREGVIATCLFVVLFAVGLHFLRGRKVKLDSLVSGDMRYWPFDGKADYVETMWAVNGPPAEAPDAADPPPADEAEQ